MTSKSNESIYIKLAAVGALITGGLGIILAINASLSNNYLGAGVLLVASALAFGFIVNVAARK